MAQRMKDNELEYRRPRHVKSHEMGVLVMDGLFLASVTFPSTKSCGTDPVAPGPLVIC